MINKITKCLSMGALLIAAANSANATVLTFDNLGLANYGNISGAYGDNVSAVADGVGSYLEGNGFTSNVVVEYRSVNAVDNSTQHANLDYWQSNYGDLAGVAFSPTNGYLGEISLVADAGYEVVLNSFDLAAYNSGVVGQTVSIFDASYNLLLDYSPYNVTGSGHDTFLPNISGQTLRIQYGPSWNVGIDNINFDQQLVSYSPVPEPSTVILLLSGLLGLRRKFIIR